MADLPVEVRQGRGGELLQDDEFPVERSEEKTSLAFPQIDQFSSGTPTPYFLSPRQVRGLEFIRKHGYITNKYYAEINSISARHALRDLDDLIAQGYIIRVGQGRSARYVLNPGRASQPKMR